MNATLTIPMPATCTNCPLRAGPMCNKNGNYTCVATGHYGAFGSTGRPECCPLVEVKEEAANWEVLVRQAGEIERLVKELAAADECRRIRQAKIYQLEGQVRWLSDEVARLCVKLAMQEKE